MWAIAMLCSMLLGVAEAVVLGIDLGSQYFKISIIQPRKPFEMVENHYSKTNSYNALSFFDKMRHKEYDAFQKMVRIPVNSFFMFTKYIGRDLEDGYLKRLRNLHYDEYKFVPTEDGDYLFEMKDFVLPIANDLPQKIDRLDGKTQLRLEEVLGMVLEYANQISDLFAKQDVMDAFFSVPPWWGPEERKILFTAAKLGGLNALGFVSENTGSAVYHSNGRKADAKNETVLFFNIGAQSTKASIFKFETLVDEKNKTKEVYTLLSEAWDEEAGGYALDICIGNYFAEEFDKKFGLETITKNTRVMRRLFKEANKIKEILSANKDTVFIVEEVFQNKDFSLKITKEDFEARCGTVLTQAVETIGVALSRAGIVAEDVDATELIGGSIRVPKVQELVEAIMKKPANFHLNGDNSMASGIAFLAARNSVAFKTKDFVLNHGPAYEVKVEIEDPKTEGETKFHKNSTILKPFTGYGSRKVVNLNHSSDIEVTVSCHRLPGKNNPEREPYTVKWNVTGADEFLKKEGDKILDPRIQLKFVMDQLGWSALAQVTAILTDRPSCCLKLKKRSRRRRTQKIKQREKLRRLRKEPRRARSQKKILRRTLRKPLSRRR